MKLSVANEDQINKLYHLGPCIAMVWEGPSAVVITRKMKDMMKNVVHVADTIEESLKEIKLWFIEEEIVNYKLSIEDWVRI
ncbi:nucleoside diphosphate kinase-like domain superfamily [Holotrichia oblita]|uniref:Nucleoside diphosphate kinase-like domain superfamily n=1 Tax=Holotrichia oblita TaxID=644536 RepID=A0ACB9TY76_HOLOL|nr:nucleoside diphosphate kinase-like domain superfamily [Holotrichia oblita]